LLPDIVDQMIIQTRFHACNSLFIKIKGKESLGIPEGSTISGTPELREGILLSGH